jgi:hypothetical protein
MAKKKNAGTKYFGKALTDDPDDAPELLNDFFHHGELRHGDRLIRRGRPPLSGKPKTAITLRLDEDRRRLADTDQRGPEACAQAQRQDRDGTAPRKARVCHRPKQGQARENIGWMPRRSEAATSEPRLLEGHPHAGSHGQGGPREV